MLTALALCAHLAATKAVASCKATKAPTTAHFDGTAGPGLLIRSSAEQWDHELATAKAPGSPFTVYASPWARIIVLTASLSPIVEWWVASLETQCEAVSARADALEQIRIEKANPGGAVDLVRLHDLGEEVQAADAALKDNGAAYLKGVGRPFIAAICPR